MLFGRYSCACVLKTPYGKFLGFNRQGAKTQGKLKTFHALVRNRRECVKKPSGIRLEGFVEIYSSGLSVTLPGKTYDLGAP